MSFRFRSLLALIPALALASFAACTFEPGESDETEETDETEEAISYASARPSASTSASAATSADPCKDKDAECVDKGSENKLCGTRISKQQCDSDSDCTWCPAKTK